MLKKEKFIAIFILILIGALYRIFPHPPNFSPIAAIALFSGFYFRRYFIFVPVAAMFLSDLFIGFYDWKLMAAVYLSFFLISFSGLFIRKRISVVSIWGFSFAGAVLFFLITNFAVWIFSSWYPHSMAGLMECYTAAIPFFKNTLAGDLFYASVIFGAFEFFARPEKSLAFFQNSPNLSDKNRNNITL